MTTNSCSSNDLIPLSVPFLPVNLVNSPKPLGSFLPPTLLPLPLPLPLPLLAVTVEAAAKSQCHESMMILPSFSSSGPNNSASHLTLPYPTLPYSIVGHSKKKRKENRHQKKEHYSPFFDDVYWMIQKGKKGGNFCKKKKMKQSHHEGGNMGFFENQDQRNETRKKGLVGKLDVSEIAQRSPSRAIESS